MPNPFSTLRPLFLFYRRVGSFTQSPPDWSTSHPRWPFNGRTRLTPVIRRQILCVRPSQLHMFSVFLAPAIFGWMVQVTRMITSVLTLHIVVSAYVQFHAPSVDYINSPPPRWHRARDL